MAIQQIYKTIKIGYFVIPPFSMPCMEDYLIDPKCEHPGANLELFANLLGPFGLQPRFKIFDDYKEQEEALKNKTMDAFDGPFRSVDTNAGFSLFAEVADKAAFLIRKPVAQEIPTFMIVNTFGLEIWMTIAIVGAILYLFQRSIRKILQDNSKEPLAITAWWLVFGILL